MQLKLSVFLEGLNLTPDSAKFGCLMGFIFIQLHLSILYLLIALIVLLIRHFFSQMHAQRSPLLSTPR